MGASSSWQGELNLQAIAYKLIKNSPSMMERAKEIVREQGLDTNKVSTRVEWVKCGKNCKRCPHGPYLYVYWKQGGKTRSKYIGKRGK